MFGKIVIAFAALCAVSAQAGIITAAPALLPAAVGIAGTDSAVVSVKQDTNSFGYKVDETNARSYLAAAPAVAYAAAPAPLAYAAAPAPLAYAAAPAPLAYAAAPAVVAAAPVYAKSPYAFGYAYGTSNVAVAPAVAPVVKTVVAAAPAPVAYQYGW